MTDGKSGIRFEVHCGFCDAVELRSISIDDLSKKVSLSIDGDNGTLEWEVNCSHCDFPVRGSTTTADITFIRIQKEKP